MVTCTETHPERSLPCVRHEEGHTWHRAESRSTYAATDVWPWGHHEDDPDAPPAAGR